MQTFTTIVAASALLATVSGAPIKATDTCGSAPAGSGSQKPISQPTGITTAALCQAQCEADNTCLSFLFGLVNNVDECMLFSVAADLIPKQSSANLIAYDKACTSVPAVVPTAKNPTGANTAKLSVRSTCGSAPAGSGSQTPISQPTSITTAALCQAQCQADNTCLSFLFGLVNNVDECMLFSCAADLIPKQSSTNLIAYDKACTSVPAVVPTAENPTGSASSSNTGGSTTPAPSPAASPAASADPKAGSKSTVGSGSPKLAARDICGKAPTGPTGNASPIATPANIDSVDACQAQCLADASCEWYDFPTFPVSQIKY
jgi:hypothetical protein